MLRVISGTRHGQGVIGARAVTIAEAASRGGRETVFYGCYGALTVIRG